MIDIDALKALLHYDPNSGVFTWVKRRFGATPARPVGSRDPSHGYVKIRVEYRAYYAHRLAWFYMTGDWPPEQIDHINGMRHDNRFVNLRLASKAQNGANAPIRRNSQSGFKGVSLLPGGRWRAALTINGKFCHLGTFATAEEASAARTAAAEQIYGEYYRPA